MASINPLSLDFLANKPDRAAAVLQTLDAGDAAGYLSRIPVRVLAPVVEQLETWAAARILEQMPVEKSGSLLGQLSFPAAAAITRLLQPPLQSSVLEYLPASLMRALQRSLSYPDVTVGAWMDSSSPHFSQTLVVAECIELLKQSGQPFDILVVVDDNHQVSGVMPAGQLLVADPGAMMGDLANRCEPLPAHLSLSEAAHFAEWQNYSVLPVHSSRGVFLGTLSRKALNTGLAKLLQTPAPATGSSLLSHLTLAMIATTTGLLGVVMAQAKSAPGVEAE